MQNGLYRAKAVRAELGEAGTGNAQVGIEFELLDGGVTEPEFIPRFIHYYGTFTDKAVQHTLKAMRTAGWKGDDVSDLSSVGGPDAPEVSLVVENETYNGQTRPKVKWVNSQGGPMMKTPLAGEKAKQFAARMKGAVLAFDKQAGTPKPAPPTSRTGALSPEPPPPGDNFDDVPF